MFGFANPIADVLSALQLSLEVDDCVSCVYTEAANQTNDPQGIIATARKFREDYLRNHPRGAEYIDLYYRHTSAVVSLLKDDIGLLKRTANVIAENSALLESLITKQSGTVRQASVNRIALLFDRLAAAATRANQSELKKVLLRLEADVHDVELLRQFGIEVVAP